MLKDKYILSTVSIVAVTVITGAFLISSSVSADDTSIDNVSVSVPVSCSMEGTGMSSHNASIPNGTYQADIGTTTLKAYCNDSEGFAIYAIGFTSEEYGNNNLIGASLGQTIATGTATSGNTSNWAMKLDTDSAATYPIALDNSYGSYKEVPASYTKVAHRDSATDIGTSAIGAELTTTYATYISKTQNADTYNGKVRYTLVHPASEEPLQPQPTRAGYIVYHPNANSAVGRMGDQLLYNSEEQPLWASNFKRTGYGFAGWNDAFDYSGNLYGPNQTIETPNEIRTNGLALYATWIKSVGTMQNWDGCFSLAQGAVMALTDERDGNTYAVSKLADGNCWMIENLRLDNTSELSVISTHNPSLPITNIYDRTNPTTSNFLSSPINPTQTAWCTEYNAPCIDQSMLSTNNTVLFIDNTASNYSTSGNVYSYGNYYNAYSATAGHSKNGGTWYSNALGDICPAGWRLPRGGDKNHESNNEYWSLIVSNINNGVVPNNYDSSPQPYYTGSIEAPPVSKALTAYPNNIVYSGGINGSSFSGRSSAGSYWTSTSAGSSSSAYILSVQSSYVYPGTISQFKYEGKTVRCIAGR